MLRSRALGMLVTVVRAGLVDVKRLPAFWPPRRWSSR
jgi:hypothetical protein